MSSNVVEVMARLTGNAAGMIATLGQGQAAAEKFAGSVKASNVQAQKAAEDTAKSMKDTGTAAEQAAAQQVAATAKANKAAEDHKKQWKEVSTGAIVAGAVMVAAVGMIVKSYADFDKAMSDVKAATHASGDDMARLRTLAIQAGADTAFSAKEAAQGISELSKAGVGVKDIMNGGLKGALSLAAAGEIEVADAAELAATALVTFKLHGDQIPHVADLLAAAAGKAQGSVGDMGYALKMSALVAAQTGLSIEETTGTLAAFASAGLIGSDAGTSFKTMLMRLNPTTKEAREKMAELGISAYDTNGKFMGIEAVAGNLKDSLGKLDPAARQAALGIIFGSDAIRAASVLYEQGAEGISHWIDEVNAAGYAAATAAIKQDNLRGDLEKLGGSLDSVFLKSGSGANDVLRGMVQGLEDLVDAVGSVDPKVLGLVVSLTASIGVMALVTGTGMKLYAAGQKMSEMFSKVDADGNKASSAIGKVGKAASVAMIAIAALQIAGAFAKTEDVKSTEDYANALLKVSEAGHKAKASDLNSIFQGWDKNFGQDVVTQVDGIGDAVSRLAHTDWHDDLNRNFADPLNSMFGFAKTEIGQVTDRFHDMGNAMGDLVANGGAESAAKSFSLLSDEFAKNGKSAQDALDVLPGYKNALLNQAQAAGVSLTPNELLMYALSGQSDKVALATAQYGVMTDAQGRAVPITESLAKALDEIGVSADGTIVKVQSLIDKMQAAGLMALSERDSQRSYAEALNAVGLNADGTGAKIGEMGLNMDTNTEQGRKNQAMLDTVARQGMNVTKSMAQATDAFGNNIYTQEQLQANLSTTYQNMITAAGQFGITGGEADALARKVMGIPAGKNIDTWMSDYAKQMADNTKQAVNNIPNSKSVTVGIQVYGMDQIAAAQARLDTLNANSMIAANAFATGAAYNKWNGGPIRKFASGGYNGPVSGPGTGTSDSILAFLSNGEYVMKASAVAKFGMGFMDAVNSGYMPDAGGTAIASPSAGMGISGGGGSTILAPSFTVEVEVPGLGERLTGRIVRVAQDEVAGAVSRMASNASSGRNTGRSVFI